MGFKITSELSGREKIYPGILIGYEITPLFGIRMNWLTEITYIEPYKYFVDEQRSGPFAFWHHQHHFRITDLGVEMIDILNYAVPLGPVGRIANSLIVKKRILEIFSFRHGKIQEIFGEY